MRNKQYIKRCPMCGGKADLRDNGYWSVQCRCCGVSTLRRSKLEAALYDWNRRVTR